jgi:acyl-ACP thioesterase
MGETKTFHMQRRISAAMIGCDNKVKAGAIADLLQDCSGFQIDTLDKVRAYFDREHVGFYLISRQIDILRLPEYGEWVTISSLPYACKTVYGYRNTYITDENGDFLVKAYCIGAFANLITGRLTKAPGSILPQLSSEPAIDMEYTPRKIELPDVTPIDAGCITVGKYHLDQNRHVNNARYIDLSGEFLPEDIEYNRIRIEYKQAAKRGDAVGCKLYRADNLVTTELYDMNDEKTVFSVVEYTLAGLR